MMDEKTKKSKVPGSGRKKKEGRKVSLRLARDVIEILRQQPNQTEYVEDAVRAKFSSGQEGRSERN